MSHIKQIPGRFSPSHGNIDHHISEKPTRFSSKCTSCGRVTADDSELPFYQKLGERKKDEKTGKTINSDFYCGCRGWD